MRSKKEMAAKLTQIDQGCGVGELMEFLARPWTMHLLYLLGRNGPMRFGALRRGAEGISARLLTVRLRDLEGRGFVRRTVRDVNPPEVTYHPTHQLDDMQQVLQLLHQLSDKWQREKEKVA